MKKSFLLAFFLFFSFVFADNLDNIEIKKLTQKERLQLKADIHNKSILYQKQFEKMKKNKNLNNIAKIIPIKVSLYSKDKNNKIIVKDFFITNKFLIESKKIINSDKNFNKKINQKQLLFILKNIYYKNVLQRICYQKHHKRIFISNYKYIYRFFVNNKNKPVFVFIIDEKKCNLLNSKQKRSIQTIK